MKKLYLLLNLCLLPTVNGSPVKTEEPKATYLSKLTQKTPNKAHVEDPAPSIEDYLQDTKLYTTSLKNLVTQAQCGDQVTSTALLNLPATQKNTLKKFCVNWAGDEFKNWTDTSISPTQPLWIASQQAAQLGDRISACNATAFYEKWGQNPQNTDYYYWLAAENGDGPARFSHGIDAYKQGDSKKALEYFSPNNMDEETLTRCKAKDLIAEGHCAYAQILLHQKPATNKKAAAKNAKRRTAIEQQLKFAKKALPEGNTDLNKLLLELKAQHTYEALKAANGEERERNSWGAAFEQALMASKLKSPIATKLLGDLLRHRLNPCPSDHFEIAGHYVTAHSLGEASAEQALKELAKEAKAKGSSVDSLMIRCADNNATPEDLIPLARIYHLGQGVNADKKKARALFERAGGENLSIEEAVSLAVLIETQDPEVPERAETIIKLISPKQSDPGTGLGNSLVYQVLAKQYAVLKEFDKTKQTIRTAIRFSANVPAEDKLHWEGFPGYMAYTLKCELTGDMDKDLTPEMVSCPDNRDKIKGMLALIKDSSIAGDLEELYKLQALKAHNSKGVSDQLTAALTLRRWLDAAQKTTAQENKYFIKLTDAILQEKWFTDSTHGEGDLEAIGKFARQSLLKAGLRVLAKPKNDISGMLDAEKIKSIRNSGSVSSTD